MFDYNKLKGKIRECCGTQKVFALRIGKNPITISQKLNNKKTWTQDEIWDACEVFGVTDKPEEISQLFFTIKVKDV